MVSDLIKEMYTEKEVSKIMDFASCCGGMLMTYGGELWRTEDTLRRLLETYRLENISIFLFPDMMIISAGKDGSDPVVRQRNIEPMTLNLAVVSRINAMTRRVVQDPPPVAELEGLLEELNRENTYTPAQSCVGTLLGISALCLMFGGGAKELLYTDIMAFAIFWWRFWIGRVWANTFVSDALLSFAVGMCTFGISWQMAGLDPYTCLITLAMVLIPGIPLVNSARELLAGRTMPAIMLFLQAFLETCAVIGGFALAIAITQGQI